MTLPGRYGAGLAPFKAIQGDTLTIKLLRGGINISKAPEELEEGESTNAIDVRLHDGGVSSDFGLTALGTAFPTPPAWAASTVYALGTLIKDTNSNIQRVTTAGTSGGAQPVWNVNPGGTTADNTVTWTNSGLADPTILHLAEFEKKVSTGVKLVRMRTGGWDRWDGTSWLTLPMAAGLGLSNINTDRIYTVAKQDRLVAANKVNQLLSWDGTDAGTVQALSADAPVAWFISPIGQRLFAARVKIGASVDPYAVAWSTDGDITNWTSSALGAGSGTLEPEVRGGPDFIMGVSGSETGLVIYRQRSIMFGLRTGVGASPFVFYTSVYGLGTEAPYTVKNIGETVGDIFLGHDLSVYLYSGKGSPTILSDPIRLSLISQIQDPSLCVGEVDRRNWEYWLLIKQSATLPILAWVLSLKELLVNKRISWRQRQLPAGYSTAVWARTATQSNPVVNSVNIIVNTIATRVNDYGLSISPSRVILGDGVGGASYSDETKFLATGNWESKILGKNERYTGLDRVYIVCQSPTGATVEVSISNDGGQTWTLPKSITVTAGRYAQAFGTWFDIVTQRWQYRLRILSGQVTISEIRANIYDRGPVPT